jgi:leader peptidase (prepilin peptidase) / N-methyltransferase
MVYFIIALFGLAFGSFLNVCVVRLPQGTSIVAPRSRCPRCGHLIRWYDNIPLASYIVLRGRCRDCRTRISPLYLLVESLTAALLLADFGEYGFTPEFIKWAVFSMMVLVLIFTDFRERRLPHVITIFGAALGLLLSGLVPVNSQPLGWILARMGYFPEGTALSVEGAIAGALLGGGMFYAVGEAFYRLRHKEGLGFGDVMLMLMVGTFAGPALTLMTILLGSLLGSLIAVPLYLASKRFREYEWPYGSFLGIAAIFVSLGGEQLLRAYLTWAGVL